MGHIDDEKKDSRYDITARMRSLANGKKGVSHRDFERVLREREDIDITIKELRQLVSFATDQFGFWMAEWLFSPIQSPNMIAKAEVDGWRPLLRVCTDQLVMKIPEVKEHLEKEQDLILLQHSLKRRIDFSKSRPFERYFAMIFSSVSIALDRVGFKGIAHKLYERSLYPKGTVGRASE
jgi:hypothetical protein